MSGIIDTVGQRSGIVGSDVYPAGHVIQTQYDTYAPSGAFDISTTADDHLAANLEVSITCASTSNKLFIQLFLPDQHNYDDAGRSVHTGFRYHASFSGSDGTQLGEREFIDSHHAYFNADNTILINLNVMHVCAVPVTTAIKIRPWFQSRADGNIAFFGNAGAQREVGTLLVQEIKG